MHHMFVGLCADLHRAGDRSADWVLEQAAEGHIFAAGHGEAGNDLPGAALVVDGRTGRRRLGDHRPQDLRQPVAGVDVPRGPRHGHQRSGQPADRPRVRAPRRARATGSSRDLGHARDAGRRRPTTRSSTARSCPTSRRSSSARPGSPAPVCSTSPSSPGRCSASPPCTRRSPSARLRRDRRQDARAHVDGLDPLDGLPPRACSTTSPRCASSSRRSTPTSTACRDDWANGVDHGADWPAKIVACKYDVVNRAFAVVDTALDLTGGAGIFKRNAHRAAVPRRPCRPLPSGQHACSPTSSSARSASASTPTNNPRWG